MRIRLETITGPECIEGRLAVTPVARSLTVCCALKDRDDVERGEGGRTAVVFRRQWPSAVVVSMDGQMSRLPIVDATRWAQVAIILVAILWIIEARGRARTRKERTWTTPSTT
jgi:hypothetical protein